MNRLITRLWPAVAIIVDALLIIDIGSDLVKKYKERKAEKQTTESTVEESAPVVEEA